MFSKPRFHIFDQYSTSSNQGTVYHPPAITFGAVAALTMLNWLIFQKPRNWVQYTNRTSLKQRVQLMLPGRNKSTVRAFRTVVNNPESISAQNAAGFVNYVTFIANAK